ncbi:uncharacterized protein LOC106135138 isoform X2 [Amyelois transitella]|nr:uncharacterized protein LOC106135138 isoform X2 [Amyelois transitella]XP_060801536.1 uncharacterized protein LOC106135138 isoform X2 [Amyelois transitella]
MNMTDGNSSEKSDLCSVNIAASEKAGSSNMDLISFTNNEDYDVRTSKDKINAGAEKDGLASSASASSVKTELESNDLAQSVSKESNNLNIKTDLNKKSTLNVEASAYVPRFNSQIEGLNMQNDITPLKKDEKIKESGSHIPEKNTFQSLISYSNVSRRTGAVPKKVVKSVKHEDEIKLSPELRRIGEYHNHGFRMLILMRGAPGSGKSYLSRQIVKVTVGDNPVNFKTHILSTDDFFSLRGSYDFNKYYLRDAHAWNQQRAKTAMEKGLSPVIIDNTNIEVWEMEPYVQAGVANGYKIQVVEPKTPWARKPNQLFKKNTHGVSLSSITRMLENYAENVTGDYLIQYYKLTYPDHMTPPFLRNDPPVITSTSNNIEYVPKGVRMVTTTKRVSPEKEQQSAHSSITIPNEKVKDKFFRNSNSVKDPDRIKDECVTPSQYNTNPNKSPVSQSLGIDDTKTKSEENKMDLYENIQRELEDFERLDREWESNPPWEENAQNQNDNKSDLSNEPKPPRNCNSTQSEFVKINWNAVNNCSNWTEISMFMKPWSDGTEVVEKEPVIPVEKKTTGTCVEIGDTDIYNSQNIYKVVSAMPRDINEHHISPYREKIPEMRMLDKSSMTNEQSLVQRPRCKNEERHFIAFRKMFKTISKTGLRDIFDQCRGDVNWAVEIVLDGISNNQLQFSETLDVSDVEEEDPEQCTCLSAYDIVPTVVKHENENSGENLEAATGNIMYYQRKPKPELPLSEMSIQLKRQIEQNVVIAENHYSQHCLKIRKLRRGESHNETEENNVDETENAGALVSYSQSNNEQPDSFADNSDEDSNASVGEFEKIINMNVGREFIESMDAMFGRQGITYPENVVPRLSIPVSLVNELNALWMESLMYQLDECDKQSSAMVKQDEEFARQLAVKEMEMAEAGKEPEVPDFKEIMDMDFAMSLYQKDVEEWRNKEPDNWAAKLTRDKLFNLFPDVPQETLSELLVAHDNNFKATVEVLLMSTGRTEVLEQNNGLVKFVMAKELERQERIMEEQKKALSEVEWPLLPRGETADMETVNNYRKNAERHLVRRNKSYDKAQEYFNRGMTQVAMYYSDVATFHKQMFDQANSRAAATLIQVHALKSPNNATIDLHYLRVGEALESMDLFLDSHINKLKELQAANRGPRQHMLFFITGRGLHSQGGPRIKPAVKKRLMERGLLCRERNPGLLCARVTADNKLTYQVQI